jgi:hypothetical protein
VLPLVAVRCAVIRLEINRAVFVVILAVHGVKAELTAAPAPILQRKFFSFALAKSWVGLVRRVLFAARLIATRAVEGCH